MIFRVDLRILSTSNDIPQFYRTMPGCEAQLEVRLCASSAGRRLCLQIRMLQVMTGCILMGFAERENFGLFKRTTEERNAGRVSRGKEAGRNCQAGITRGNGHVGMTLRLILRLLSLRRRCRPSASAHVGVLQSHVQRLGQQAGACTHSGTLRRSEISKRFTNVNSLILISALFRSSQPKLA
jgi:hypothetical protein